MPLRYPAEWKFDGIGFAMPREADLEFFQLVQKIATGHSKPQMIFEAFKFAFGAPAHSSSASWAESDLAAR